MEQTQSKRPQQDCPQNQLNQKPRENEGIGFLTCFFYLNSLSSQLLNLSNCLNVQLAKNQFLIDVVASQGYQPSNTSQKESKSDYNSTASNLDSKYMMKAYPSQHKNEKQLIRKRKSKNSSESQQYQPSSDVQERWSYYNTNSSKKIATDYCRAILEFIHREPVYVSRLLSSLSIEQNQFKESLQKYRGKVNSLVQFHSIWRGHEDNFCKAFRIISMQYSRKHRLAHIFALKANNYCKHIKYRNKIMQAIKKPFLQEQRKD